MISALFGISTKKFLTCRKPPFRIGGERRLPTDAQKTADTNSRRLPLAEQTKRKRRRKGKSKMEHIIYKNFEIMHFDSDGEHKIKKAKCKSWWLIETIFQNGRVEQASATTYARAVACAKEKKRVCGYRARVFVSHYYGLDCAKVYPEID